MEDKIGPDLFGSVKSTKTPSDDDDEEDNSFSQQPQPHLLLQHGAGSSSWEQEDEPEHHEQQEEEIGNRPDDELLLLHDTTSRDEDDNVLMVFDNDNGPHRYNNLSCHLDVLHEPTLQTNKVRGYIHWQMSQMELLAPSEVVIGLSSFTSMAS